MGAEEDPSPFSQLPLAVARCPFQREMEFRLRFTFFWLYRDSDDGSESFRKSKQRSKYSSSLPDSQRPWIEWMLVKVCRNHFGNLVCGDFPCWGNSYPVEAVTVVGMLCDDPCDLQILISIDDAIKI